MPKDYYKTLGINRDASAEDIKKAFRRLAHEFHPDKPGGGNEAKFKEANTAYQVLSDTEKRQQYDQFGTTFEDAGAGGHAHGPGFQGFGNDFGFSAGGGPASGWDFGNMNDVFGDFFGGGQTRGRRAPHGGNIEVDVTIDFVDSAKEVSRTLSLRRPVSCDACAGSGMQSGSKMKKCDSCHGRGQTTQSVRTILGTIQTSNVCSACEGVGEAPEKKCKTCNGEGRVQKTTDIEIRIPAGIENGEVVRFTGQGEAGPKGSRPGDLYVRVRVRGDARFHREGDSLIIPAIIPFTIAIMGGTITIPTLEGEGELKIPGGTQPGALIRLQDKGFPNVKSGRRGDLMVQVTVDIPKHLSRKQRKMLEEFDLG